MWSEIPLGDTAHDEATEIPGGKSEKLKLFRRKGTRRKNYRRYNRRTEELQRGKLIRFCKNKEELVQQAT
jgi:hypothetical protein